MFQNHLFINNRTLLCLSNANQQIDSWELKKNLKKVRHLDCLWKWETRYNAEWSQWITKFMIDDKQYS